jgi:WD40 repeat protein
MAAPDSSPTQTDILHTIQDFRQGRFTPSFSNRLLRSHRALLYRLRPVPVPEDDRVNYHHNGNNKSIFSSRKLSDWLLIRSYIGCVNRLCWSPNGGVYLGSVSDDRTIRIWGLDNDHSLKLKQTLPTVSPSCIFLVRL